MKKKQFSKILSVFMAACLLILSACSGSSAQPAPAPAAPAAEAPAAAAPAAPAASEAPAADASAKKEKIIIAYPQADSGNARYTIMANTVKRLGALEGIDFVFEDTNYSPEAQVAFFENQIAAGAKGVLFWPAADAMLPTIAKLCEDNGVYWCITFRSIQDEEIKKIVYDSPHYLGRVNEDEETTGYQIGKEAADLGYKKLAVLCNARGESASDARYVGLLRACEEFGMEVVAEYRDPKQPADITSATESFLSANSDLDGVCMLASVVADTLNPIAKAIMDAGKQDSVGILAVDFWDGMTDLFETGILKVCIGHPHIGYDPYISAVKLVNQLSGNPISAEKIDNVLMMFPIRTYEDSKISEDKYLNVDALYYSDEWVSKNLLKRNNPALDGAMLQKYMDEWDPLKEY